jgi:glyoxylase-like metal-dependent hydrolase (beta-lactamase superfamily II)
MRCKWSPIWWSSITRADALITAVPVTRRTLLATAAAGLVARGGFAFAAPAPYRFKQGQFEIIVVSDGHLVLPTSFLAPDAPTPERDALLKAAGQASEQYDSPTNITLIRTATDLILIDAGSGDRFMPTAGKLFDNLKAAGIEKSAITKLVFTHGHPDHLWGALDELDELALPNIPCFVAAAEWDFWHSDNASRGLPAERAGFVTGARRRYDAIKQRVRIFKPGDDIVTGVRALDTPGHTQGHIAFEVGGGLIVGADALTHPLISFQHPQWRPIADHVPDQAVTTRQRLLDRLAIDRLKLIGFHLPYPGLGTVERANGSYRFVPVA